MLTRAMAQHIRALAIGIALLATSGLVAADPPSRVARLGYTSGEVSFSPAGEEDWVRATLNRPLGTGDRLWSEARGRAEIQVGGATIRMDANTGLSVLNLDDRIVQLQLTQGVLNVRVRRLERDQAFEVDTPHLAFVLRQPGEYRIEVVPDSDETRIVMWQGQGEVYGENASYLIDARQPYRFTGTDLRDRRPFDAPGIDDFDRWARDRDRAFDSSPSARYVSRDVIGYQDLDAHGTWRSDPTYGHVWVPSYVEAGWAPYRDGHWAWIDPWGWTWVDDAPWGFAVSHYGRWANPRGTWVWVPGPVRSQAYYAPALVVFLGGANFQITLSTGTVGGVAWFPLGPREVYRPAYPVSRSYFERVNQSNTVINNTVIHNVYNNVNVTRIVNVNRSVTGAVVAVPTSAFAQSQPVSKAAVRVSREAVVSQQVAIAPPVAPTPRSVRGAANEGERPPAKVFERPVVARNAPPPPGTGFAAQEPQLTAKQGRPLDESERKALKPAVVRVAPAVKVLTASPTLTPAGKSPGGTPRDEQEPRARPGAPAASATAIPAPRQAPGKANPEVAPGDARPGKSAPRDQAPGRDRPPAAADAARGGSGGARQPD
jgi:hypothetical protein